MARPIVAGVSVYRNSTFSIMLIRSFAMIAWMAFVGTVMRNIGSVQSFAPPQHLQQQKLLWKRTYHDTSTSTTTTKLFMGLDMVTYLRTEWVSAALCTNQTPRTAEICVQLGVEDGRAVDLHPAHADGILPPSTRRQLKQQQERRNAARVIFVDQRADDLKEVKNESVDVVISLQAAARMVETGLDWKKSIREAARVLKPGGRFLFVEQSEFADGGSYLEYVKSLYNVDGIVPDDADKRVPIFEVGSDEVDLVLVPHMAGVAVKTEDGGLTPAELAKKAARAERDRLADLSIAAFGRKKRRKPKKVVEGAAPATTTK